jgi:pimeloyl-ACP methyl ester carboxylesterase
MELNKLAVGPNRLTVHYARAGRGAPLLYLHGMLGLVGFDAAFARLAEHFDVIAPNAPGWGPAKDDLPLFDAGPLDLTLHHCDLLDALGIARAHVAGTSIGGWMAAELAAIAPHRVDRLVLVNSVGLWLDEVQGADPFAVHPGMPSELLFSAPGLRKKFVLAERDKVDAHVEELLDLRASAKFLWPIPDTGIRKRLPRITAPTLVVVCEGDRIVPPAYGPVWQQAIPNAHGTTWAGASHVPEIEQPQRFAEMVREFLLDSRVAAVA